MKSTDLYAFFCTILIDKETIGVVAKELSAQNVRLKGTHTLGSSRWTGDIRYCFCFGDACGKSLASMFFLSTLEFV